MPIRLAARLSFQSTFTDCPPTSTESIIFSGASFCHVPRLTTCGPAGSIRNSSDVCSVRSRAVLWETTGNAAMSENIAEKQVVSLCMSFRNTPFRDSFAHDDLMVRWNISPMIHMAARPSDGEFIHFV